MINYNLTLAIKQANSPHQGPNTGVKSVETKTKQNRIKNRTKLN